MRENIRFQWTALIAVLLIALVTSVPMLGLLQNEKELANKHSRKLNAAPEWSLLLTEPKTFFDRGRLWFSDRVMFSADAPVAYHKFQYHVLKDAGSDMLARNGDFIFVRSIGDARERDSSFLTSCPVEERWDFVSGSLISAWERIQRETRARGVEAYALIIPSKPVLYADKLPPQVSRSIRGNCLANYQGNNPVRRLAEAFPDSVSYPLDQMSALKDEPHFYPSENFHTEGWSAAIAASAVISKSSDSDWREPRITLEEAPADLERILGFGRTIMINTTRFPSAGRRDKTLERQFNKGQKLGITTLNKDPADPRHIGIISNSFGPTLHPALGSHYRTATLMNTNGRMGRGLEKVLEHGAYETGMDQVIFVMHEVGYYDRLERFAEAFENIAAGKEAPSGPDAAFDAEDGLGKGDEAAEQLRGQIVD